MLPKRDLIDVPINNLTLRMSSGSKDKTPRNKSGYIYRLAKNK